MTIHFLFPCTLFSHLHQCKVSAKHYHIRMITFNIHFWCNLHWGKWLCRAMENEVYAMVISRGDKKKCPTETFLKETWVFYSNFFTKYLYFWWKVFCCWKTKHLKSWNIFIGKCFKFSEHTAKYKFLLWLHYYSCLNHNRTKLQLQWNYVNL